MLSRDQAEEIIRKAYGTERNFVTPEVVEVGLVNTPRGDVVAYEISRGEAPLRRGERIYGVSFVMQRGEKVARMLTSSGAVSTGDEARSKVLAMSEEGPGKCKTCDGVGKVGEVGCYWCSGFGVS